MAKASESEAETCIAATPRALLYVQILTYTYMSYSLNSEGGSYRVVLES